MKKLDLTDWAAAAEIVGTVAVVVSLLFVGMNIKQNTAAVQAMNDNVLYEMTDTFRELISANTSCHSPFGLRLHLLISGRWCRFELMRELPTF